MTGDGRDPDRVPLRDGANSLPFAAYGQPTTRLDTPIPVRVWVPRDRPHGWKQLDGLATAYTSVAVAVDYVDEHGRTGHVWVWAGAVTRVTASPRPRPPEESRR